MAKKRSPKPDDAKQSKCFVDKARELEVDESGKSFERVFSAIAKQAATKLKKKK